MVRFNIPIVKWHALPSDEYSTSPLEDADLHAMLTALARDLVDQQDVTRNRHPSSIT
jgi:hypothetical protein